jgi:hypothetical protein
VKKKNHLVSVTESFERTAIPQVPQLSWADLSGEVVFDGSNDVMGPPQQVLNALSKAYA